MFCQVCYIMKWCWVTPRVWVITLSVSFPQCLLYSCVQTLLGWLWWPCPTVQVTTGNHTAIVLSSYCTLFSPYSAPLCRLLHPLSPSAPWLNEPQPCLVEAGSPYKAWGWSQQAARYLSLITTPLTSPCRLPQTICSALLKCTATEFREREMSILPLPSIWLRYHA